MSDLISRSAVIDIIHKYSCNTARIEENVLDLPTSYDVEKVVAELEHFAKLAEDRWVNGTSNHAYQEHKCWVKAIDIVKRGGTDLGYNPYQE